MSKPGLGRGAGGGKWTSTRVSQSQHQPTASSPTVATPMSAPHAAGGHGFEDSAVNEHARRHHTAAADETSLATHFDRQTAADALSNLWFFRATSEPDDFELLEVKKRIIQPSGINFHQDVLTKIKPPK